MPTLFDDANKMPLTDTRIRGLKAYHRATYWDERVRMAEWWAAEVVKFAAK